MEDDDNSNSSTHGDGDQNKIVQQLLRTNISSKIKESFWYDIQNFPDALLIEILGRLPVKSIFMFKSVCKHWQTLISHPSFCRFYYSILNSNGASLSRHFRILGDYIYVPSFREFIDSLHPDIDSSSEFSVLFLSLHEERYQYCEFRVLDTSKGLILFQSGRSERSVYYICDTLTRQWITLPTRERRCQGDFVEGLITRVSEDHMLTGYTVVRVELVRSQSDYLTLEMFSSETGKRICYKPPCTIPGGLEEEFSGAIHCYGALHWRVSNDYGIHGLLAFDPYKDPKSVCLISLPEDRDLQSELRDGGYFQLCGKSEGTLRVFEVADVEYMADDDYLFSMWAMKDYEKGEWCCEFKVRRSDLHSNHPKLSKWLLDGRWFLPLSFHPLNPDVVYLTCMEPKCVVSYDVLNKRLDVASKPFGICKYISQCSAIPFMLPRWPLLVSVTKTEVSIS